MQITTITVDSQIVKMSQGMARSKYNRLNLHLLAAASIGLLVLAVPAHAADTSTPYGGPRPATQAPPMQAPSPHAATWCEDHVLGRLTEEQRMAGRNLQRLKAAQSELAPGFNAGAAMTELRLIAAYQEELEKRKPNIDLSASYLAMASAVPITDGRVRQVNALLCVSTTRTMAKAVVTAAEAQRRQMTR